MSNGATGENQRRVDIIVERQWYVGIFVPALIRAGCFGMVYGGFPRFRYLQAGVPGDHLRVHPFAALWNQVLVKAGISRFRIDEAKATGQWAARQPGLAKYIDCVSVASRFVMPALAGKGHIFILESGATYPEDHYLFEQRAFKEAGFPYSTELPQGVKDQIDTLRMAHFVSVGSQFVVDSYVKRGFPAERMLRVTYGADHELFTFRERAARAGEPVRIACVGVIGLRKGILRLIRLNEWAKEKGIPCELWLIGPVEREAEILLGRSSAPYRALGVHKGQALVDLLHQCDLYCLPSYEEGFPSSVLEAMLTGIPAIVSDDTGGREAVIEGESGTIVRDFEPPEFEAKVKPMLLDEALRRRMGANARARAETNYTLPHYYDRVKSEFNRMFEMVEAAGGDLSPAWKKPE